MSDGYLRHPTRYACVCTSRHSILFAVLMLCPHTCASPRWAIPTTILGLGPESMIVFRINSPIKRTLQAKNDFFVEFKMRHRSKWHRSETGLAQRPPADRLVICPFRNRTYIAVQSAPRRGRHTLRRTRCAAACRSRN